MDKLLLIPQLLTAAEIEVATATCQTCEKRLGEKRRHPRTRRPLKGALRKGAKTPIPVDIIDLSPGGALLKLKNWIEMKEGEEISLELYPPRITSTDGSPSPLRVSALVKRVETDRGHLAIAFLENNDISSHSDCAGSR